MAVNDRLDSDIRDDVIALAQEYPPFMADRHQVHVTVESGVVSFRGHVKSAITRRWLQDNISAVEGVVRVNTDGLYDEQTIRLEAGQVIPAGVQANVRYGLVILSGFLSADTTAETVAQAVTRIPGVERVVLDF